MEVTSRTTTTLKDRVVDSLLNNYRNFMKSKDVSMDISLLPNWPIEFKLCKISTDSATISHHTDWMHHTYTISTERRLREYIDGKLRI